MSYKNFDYLVVGAGFFGSVIAERIAEKLGLKVLVIDSRNHIGGNSYSYNDPSTGIEVHKYGSHIFHTSNRQVWDYVHRFTSFNDYRHKVLTFFEGKVYTMPINLFTINAFYGINLRPYEVEPFIKKEIERDFPEGMIPSNLEEKAISLIGRPLYEAFIKGYTQKHWGIDPRNLPSEVITRLPVRNFYAINYFDDPMQGIPLIGYGELFKKILQHDNIQVMLNTDFFDIKKNLPANLKIIYTGAIDRFFEYQHGELNWRAVEFDQEIFDLHDYQGTSVMNYADAGHRYTRAHEFKHYHPERPVYKEKKTIVFHERSKKAIKNEMPSYPMNTAEDLKKLALYEKEAACLSNVFFGGRLGTYKYLDMDKVIASALTFFDEKIKKGP